MICKDCPYNASDSWEDIWWLVCTYPPNNDEDEEPIIGKGEILESKPEWCKLPDE
jgi:hypothetical protein